MPTKRYMARALELARRGEGRTRPNPPVGAVLVRDRVTIGEGFHPRAGEPHAEIFALRAAGPAARGADLYVTLEPCAHTGRTGPCTEAVIAAGVARVFIGTSDPNPLVSGRGIERLKQAGIQVHTGLLAAECRRLIAPFAKHVTSGRPFVILKTAMTLDGRTATVTGESRWITGESSREHVHRVRDRVDAIMVGIGTVLADDPRLTTRLPEGGGRDPLRVIVDSRLRIPESATVLRLSSPEQTLIATTASAPTEKMERLRALGIRILTVGKESSRVDLRDLLMHLGGEGIQSILLEGGSCLNNSAMSAGLVDRVMFYLAPMLLWGDDGKGVFSGSGPRRLVEAAGLDDVRVSRLGQDILVEGEVKPCLPV